jgi:hypothetical protein
MRYRSTDCRNVSPQKISCVISLFRGYAVAFQTVGTRVFFRLFFSVRRPGRNPKLWYRGGADVLVVRQTPHDRALTSSGFGSTKRNKVKPTAKKDRRSRACHATEIALYHARGGLPAAKTTHESFWRDLFYLMRSTPSEDQKNPAGGS